MHRARFARRSRHPSTSCAKIMIRALFVALLLACCSVCSATGAISLPVSHASHVYALHGRRARRIAIAATREGAGGTASRDARKRVHWFAWFGPRVSIVHAPPGRLQSHASQSPRHARRKPRHTQAPAAAITAPKSKVKAVKAVDAQKAAPSSTPTRRPWTTSPSSRRPARRASASP